MINSLMSRMAKAQELSIPQLQQAIQDGTLPAYVGIPLLQDKVKQTQMAKASQQMPAQPPVAQRVMEEANQVERGVATLPSNLPTEEMAEGGIIAFADGGNVPVDLHGTVNMNGQQGGAGSNPNGYQSAGMPPWGGAQFSQGMPQQGMPQQGMPPQYGQNMGIGGFSPQPMGAGFAAGGAIPYAFGGDVDQDDYDEYVQQAQDEQDAELANMYAEAPAAEGFGMKADYVNHTPTVNQGITANISDKDMARKHNVGNLRPVGFKYEGQVGVSPGGFAMFESKEAGINALKHDIDVKLGRGLNTPEKFLNVYAPKADKNDTEAYIRNVSKALGIKPTQEIPDTPEARTILASAIMRQEGAEKATARFAEGGIADIPSYAGPAGSLVQDVPQARMGNDLLSNYLSNLDTSSPDAPDYDAMIAQENARLRGRAPQTGIPSLVAPVPQVKQGQQLMSDYVASGPAPVAPEVVAPAAPRQLSRGQSKAAEDISSFLSPGAGSPRMKAALASEKRDGITTLKTKDEAPAKVADTSELDRERARATATAGANKRDIDAGNLQSLPTVSDITKSKIPGFDVSQPQPKQAAEQSEFEKYMAGLNESRNELKRQKDEDKYLSLLSAGLGMMAGTSPYAAANIGQGALAGVKEYGELSKTRASERAALNKELGSAMYRQALLQNTASGKAASLGLQREALTEKQREFAGKQLEGRDKAIRDQVLATYKLDPTKAITDPDVAASIEKQIAMAKQKDPTYNYLHKNYFGFDYATPSSGGDNVIRFDKTGKQIQG